MCIYMIYHIKYWWDSYLCGNADAWYFCWQISHLSNFFILAIHRRKQLWWTYPSVPLQLHGDEIKFSLDEKQIRQDGRVLKSSVFCLSSHDDILSDSKLFEKRRILKLTRFSRFSQILNFICRDKKAKIFMIWKIHDRIFLFFNFHSSWYVFHRTEFQTRKQFAYVYKFSNHSMYDLKPLSKLSFLITTNPLLYLIRIMTRVETKYIFHRWTMAITLQIWYENLTKILSEQMMTRDLSVESWKIVENTENLKFN